MNSHDDGRTRLTDSERRQGKLSRFAFAGIWSTVHDAQGRVHLTFASLTLAEAKALLMPLLAELFMAYEVSPKVNLPSDNTSAGLTAGCVGVTA